MEIPHTGCVSLVPIFNHLEPEQLAEIEKVTFNKRLLKGEYLYLPEEKSDFLYILNSGLIRIYHLNEGGKEQLIRFMHSGEFVGEMALFQANAHDSFAQAVQDTSICVLQRQDLQELLALYPNISLKIMEEFSRRLQRSEKQTTLVSTEKVETRVAIFLAELMEKDNKFSEIELPMSKKDLASYLGTTPETLSRTITIFERKKLIQKISNKKLRILDLDELLMI